MSPIYALIEPAIVGGGVLVALGFALRRFVPRLRGGAAAGGCGSGCSSCGGCGSAPAARDRPKSIVLHRRAGELSSPPGASMANPRLRPARE
jgi:FeoB-associated Cys-rich membrane protein